MYLFVISSTEAQTGNLRSRFENMAKAEAEDNERRAAAEKERRKQREEAERRRQEERVCVRWCVLPLDVV